MQGKRSIQKIKLRNILSFGDKGEEVDLQPLNVLIGQNASGKSNFVQVLKLLRYAARDYLVSSIRNDGGIDEYLWAGSLGYPIAEIELLLALEETPLDPIYYLLKFTKSGQYFEIVEEEILPTVKTDDKDFYYRNKNGQVEIVRWEKLVEGLDIERKKELQLIDRQKLNPEQSVLSQFSDPINYEVINNISDLFGDVLIFKDLKFNHNQSPRRPLNTNNPSNFLSETAENLALVLSNLQRNVSAYDKIIKYLKKFYGRLDRLQLIHQEGTLQMYFQEIGREKPISAYRLSDGTLRYLCLLSILCHPDPPPLICIEEPETGLHPDILLTIAELLIDASTRTQLVITTHSDILISALSEVPDAVLVCEFDEESGTHFQRLGKEHLKDWLDEYSLGELWLKGEIGGTRW